MNPQQRKILKGALAAVIAAFLFPPFHVIGGSGATLFLGWNFIAAAGGTIKGYPATIDVPLLIAEWLAIGIVAAILWRLQRQEPAPSAAGALAQKIDGNPAVRSAVRTALDEITSK